MVEKFFWADAIAEKIIKERQKAKPLASSSKRGQTKGKKKEYVCASGISPSGVIHIGNFREVITTDLVVRALKDKGKKVRFIYSWDDFDRFRKIPSHVPKDHEKYIGRPLSDVPSVSGKGSYAEDNEKPFENSLEKVGIKPKFIRQSLMNKKCKYAKLIKKALENVDKIRKILDKYRKEPLKKDWLPVEVYCEKCKKDSTKIKNIDGYFIEYECECGFKNKIDYRKAGVVKLKWRVDWPARWAYEKVDFEPGGIDHSVYGGSFMTGKEIAKIFDYEFPIYTFYEWVRIKGGKEFSSSKGNVLTLDEVEEVYESEVLRYIFVSTRPNKGFQISFDADVIKIYEDFDRLEEGYYKDELDPQQRRIYELSKLDIAKKKPERTSFRHLITLVQTGKKTDKKGKERSEKVKNWLGKYAPDSFKFEVQKKIKFPFKGKEKEALIELKKILKTKKLTEEELFNEFYEICEKVSIKNKEFFRAAYLAIIGKEKGPRLASLILIIGKEKVVKLLEQVG